MPQHPHVSPSVSAMGGSLYSSLAHRLARHPGETWPLHVGDTWMEPPEGCRMEDIRVDQWPGMHRYDPPWGRPALLEAVARRVSERTGHPTATSQVVITAGATGALGGVAGALVSPGDEVLIPSPHWPLISGIVRAFHGHPVQVPFFGEAEDPEHGVRLLESRRTGRTVALYLNTPSNPTGRLLSREWLEALLGWAAHQGLWVISDEVYEDYAWGGEHVPCRSLAPDRTVALHSFSKAWGMAGNRCGYAVGPPDLLDQVRKVTTHTFYSAPTASQIAALRAIDGPGDAWAARAGEVYREVGNWAADRLGVRRPDGSTFLFLDVAQHLDARGLAGFLEDCVERGLLVAPGPSFGSYPTSIRVCTTSVEPWRVRRGIEVLAGLLGR